MVLCDNHASIPKTFHHPQQNLCGYTNALLPLLLVLGNHDSTSCNYEVSILGVSYKWHHRFILLTYFSEHDCSGLIHG